MNSFIIHIFNRFGVCKEVSEWSLVGKNSALYSKDIKSCPFELVVMFDNGHEALCDDCNICLCFHSILSSPPKRKDSKMLFYSSEKQFNLLPLFVKYGDILNFDCEVISKECKRPLPFRSIVNYPPLFKWILSLGKWAFRPYGLSKQYISVPIQQLISRYNFIFEIFLRLDNEHWVDAFPVEFCKVVVSFFKDIERIRLIRYFIHCFHIMKFRFRNVNVCRNLSDYIKQCMYLGSICCLSEASSYGKKSHVEVYSRRIKRVKLSIEFKWPCNSLALCKISHIVGKLFKDFVVLVRIGIRHIAQLYVSFVETKVVALAFGGINDSDDFSVFVAVCKLSKYYDKKG